MKGLNGDFKGKQFVVKFVKEDKLSAIVSINITEEEHVRRTVQMQMILRNYVTMLENEAPSDYGECFQYVKPYFAILNGRPAEIELFVDGTFQKIINNDGSISYSPKDSDLCAKAESLTHYTFVKSNEKLMVLDIQGFGYLLIDPEICTIGVSDDDTWEFCMGNCRSEDKFS